MSSREDYLIFSKMERQQNNIESHLNETVNSVFILDSSCHESRLHSKTTTKNSRA